MAVDFQLKTPMFTLTVIHFWGTTILYYTTAHNGKGKETEKKTQLFSKGLQHLHLFSFSTVVLLRPSVPLPASAKKHSSIAIYPSWPVTGHKDYHSWRGLPLMFRASCMNQVSINSPKNHEKSYPSQKKGESLISWGKKPTEIENWCFFPWKFCRYSQLDSIFSGFLHDSWGRIPSPFGCFQKIGVPPKWMVYNGKPYKNGWFGGTTIFGNIHFFEGQVRR